MRDMRTDVDDSIHRRDNGSWLVCLMLLVALLVAIGLGFARTRVTEIYARHDMQLPQITVWAISIPNEVVVAIALVLALCGVVCQLLIADKSLVLLINGGLLLAVVVTTGLITAAALLPMGVL